mmetsp:Transcript_131533/g.281174  ORF Transcript_131533/g.281174 Transcript_131533/m.281174 type:complete len:590 (+) Transcript_131533:52-1821(+)
MDKEQRRKLEADAVNRIFALIKNSQLEASRICEAVHRDGDVSPSPEQEAGPQDRLQLLMAGLQSLGPREFLDRTVPLLPAGSTVATAVSRWKFKGSLAKARPRVAIYGGAFDPITNSHLTCAAEIVHSGCADEVWLVPCGPRPDKPKLTTPAIDRYCMCQLAVNTTFSHKFPVKVIDVECLLPKSIATYDLLCLLRRSNPGVDFSFIIGSDWLQPGSNMAEWTSANPEWKPGDPEDQRDIVTGHLMLQEFNFLVIKRPGYEVERTKEDPTGLKQFGPRLSWLAMQNGATFIEGNLSSTEIRKRAAAVANQSEALVVIDGLVPRGVLSYIWRHGFYIPKTIEPPGRKRVAIYGGAFDPVTNSHLTCAAQIVHSKCADEVWLVPCGPRPDKPGLTTSPMDRFCMCKVAVNTVFTIHLPIKVSRVECFSEQAFYTYDLLCTLRKDYPMCDFKFIIGSDWLQPGTDLATWTSANHDWKPGDPEDQKAIVTGHKLLVEFDFLVIKRPGYEVQPTADDPTGLRRFGPRLHWLEMQAGQNFIEGNLSSTEVRQRSAHASRVRSAAAGQDFFGIDGLVPSSVLAYIRRRGLYTVAGS